MCVCEREREISFDFFYIKDKHGEVPIMLWIDFKLLSNL